MGEFGLHFLRKLIRGGVYLKVFVLRLPLREEMALNGRVCVVNLYTRFPLFNMN